MRKIIMIHCQVGDEKESHSNPHGVEELLSKIQI